MENVMFSDRKLLIMLGLTLGGISGAIVLHPFSMFVQGFEHPLESMSLQYLMDAFNTHHIPMISMYMLFGATSGYLIFILGARSGMGFKNVSGIQSSLIPICSYCKKIRDDKGTTKGDGPWSEVEVFFSRKCGSDFTHSICPGCVDKFFDELNGRPYKES